MPELNAIGISVSDMAGSIRFYRLVGLDGVRVNLYAPL